MANKRRRTRSSKESERNYKGSRQNGRFDDPKSRDYKSNDRGNNHGEPKGKEGDGYNDVSWYSRYPSILIPSASFPYPYRPGMHVDFSQGASNFFNYEVPGVMALTWIPSVGVSSLPTDPASIVGKELYARVRSAYSGELVADAPDFVIYLLGMDSIFSYIASLKRIYRILTAWSPDNYALPDVLLYALGIPSANAQALRADKTRFLQVINELILQSRKFQVPAVMDYFNRHYWMNDNVYTDAPSLNSQMYVFNQAGMYKYAQVANPQGELSDGLVMVSHSQNVASVDVFYQIGLELIQAMDSWATCYTISGYLKRAFQDAPTFIVEELRSDEVLTPIYNTEVLSQIENSRTVGITPNTMAWSATFSKNAISQDPLTNAIISHPGFVVEGDDMNVFSSNMYLLKPWLTSRVDMPSVADNVIYSRLQFNATVAIPSTESGTLNYTVDGTCGSELPLFWSLYTGSGGYLPVYQLMHVDDSQANFRPSSIMFQVACTNFDWAPLGLVRVVTAGGETLSFIRGDVHNLTVISANDLANLHRVCLFSEFNSFSIS